MNVQIYSRYSAEKLIQNHFPDSTAVICFYNPNETHLDYNGAAEDVIYIPLDTFQTDLPQADRIADFIRRAESKKQNIICQCEKGQSRSAGCAAAIMEYYNNNGQSVFDDDKYRPDDMVYYAVLNALDKAEL